MSAENDAQEDRLPGALAKVEATLAGMERALSLAQQWPTELDRRLTQLKELHDAQLAAIKDAAAANDRLYAERSELVQRLVQQQHESSQQAIVKAESSMRAQLEKVEQVNDTITRALSQRIDSEKDRITQIESRFKGAGQLWGGLLGGTALVVLLLGFIYSMQ